MYDGHSTVEDQQCCVPVCWRPPGVNVDYCVVSKATTTTPLIKLSSSLHHHISSYHISSSSAAAGTRYKTQSKRGILSSSGHIGDSPQGKPHAAKVDTTSKAEERFLVQAKPAPKNCAITEFR